MVPKKKKNKDSGGNKYLFRIDTGVCRGDFEEEF